MVGRRIGFLGLAVVIAGVLIGPGAGAAQEAGLTPFTSGAELASTLEQDPVPAAICDDDDPCIDEVVVVGARASTTPTVTNNQEAGVDEGDIVKAIGDTLVILRRGRLFTVDTRGGTLRALDRIDAFAPGVDGSRGWYDEMLVADNWIVVIGYSYVRDGTEINRFRLGPAGQLTFVDSHILKSEDYYSSRNYASRLLGQELVTYAPIDAWRRDPLRSLPTLVRWVPGQDEAGYGGEAAMIMQASDVYRTTEAGADKSDWRTLHTVIRCDLTAPQLQCRGEAVLGPRSRSYYVSSTAVYVWVTDDELTADDSPERAWLFRMPLNGDKPTAAATLGSPIDQFSFNEVPEARRIDVLTLGQRNGDAMWDAEDAAGDAALLSLPFDRFGSGEADPNKDDYRRLPAVAMGWGAQNRFVGEHLLYAFVTTDDPGYREDEVVTGVLTVVPLDGGQIRRMAVPGRIGRIDIMGRDAIVTSDPGDGLYFTTVDLTGPIPRFSDQYVLAGGEESESRSHAYFFQPDGNSPDGARGVLGLPVLKETDQPGRYPDEMQELGTVTYLRRGDQRLSPLGSLDATPGASLADDGCVASCIDWYGDARPIFLNGRVFALLGYELVEGRESGGRIREVRRIDMTPPAPEGPRPYYRD